MKKHTQRQDKQIVPKIPKNVGFFYLELQTVGRCEQFVVIKSGSRTFSVFSDVLDTKISMIQCYKAEKQTHNLNMSSQFSCHRKVKDWI